MLSKSTILKHYKRPEIQEAMVAHSKNKEVGMCYNGEAYGKRPDIISYPRDVLELALKGVTSFHASEELWDNPLMLGTTLRKEELLQLRIGWDLVLDIDCKFFEYSRICANLIIRFLQYCGVQDISIKFSGNKGFHIGVPFQAFPASVGGQRIHDLFPEAPRKIAAYVKEQIKEELGRQILAWEKGDFSKVKDKVNLPAEEIISYHKTSVSDKVARLQVDAFLEIDTILLASRHLYRMPYSLHEKSGLVSVPLPLEQVATFERQQALPELVVPQIVFLSRDALPESARRLLLQAMDFNVKTEQKEVLSAKKYEEMTLHSPISEDFFPPCMRRISQGLEDGKKRGLFCLINFLGKVGWSKEQIEAYLKEWNTRNPEPLREVYIKGQLQHFVPGEKLPPNCDNDSYYQGLGIGCHPNDHCKRLKNPVNYTLSRWRRYLREKEEQEEKQAEKLAEKSARRKEKGNNEEMPLEEPKKFVENQ